MNELRLESDKPATKTKCWQGTADEAAARLGLTRRPFYRWIDYGKANDDPFPVNEPDQVVDWYNRMRAAGVFKHKCPQSVVEACSGVTPEPDPVENQPGNRVNERRSSESHLIPGTGAVIPPVMPVIPPTFEPYHASGSVGIAVEREALERRVAYLRLQADNAFASGQNREAKQWRDQYNVALEQLRRITKDSPDEEAEKRQWEAWFAEDLNGIIPGMISGWMGEAGNAHRELESSLPRAEFKVKWKAIIGRVCRMLAESKFAVALELEAEG